MANAVRLGSEYLEVSPIVRPNYTIPSVDLEARVRGTMQAVHKKVGDTICRLLTQLEAWNRAQWENQGQTVEMTRRETRHIRPVMLSLGGGKPLGDDYT